MKKPVILVTGAGGFIGGWIAEAFHLSGWAHVKAGISRWSSAARIARFPLDIVQCDVMNKESLDAALKGVDVVVHCARAKGNDNSVTLSGTRLLLDRVKAAGVKKLIFTSSVATYGEATGIVTEDTPPAAPISEYGEGKRQAEAICRAAGTSIHNAVRIQQFHTDLADLPAALEVWDETMDHAPLPLSSIEVAWLPVAGACVMVDLWVHVPGGSKS